VAELVASARTPGDLCCSLLFDELLHLADGGNNAFLTQNWRKTSLRVPVLVCAAPSART
jgi:hypothetical protein